MNKNEENKIRNLYAASVDGPDPDMPPEVIEQVLILLYTLLNETPADELGLELAPLRELYRELKFEVKQPQLIPNKARRVMDFLDRLVSG